MSIKINYSSDIGGAKQTKQPSGSEFQIPSNIKRQEIFTDYVRKNVESGITEPPKEYLDRNKILNKKQSTLLLKQKNEECKPYLNTFFDKNYRERKDYLKNENFNKLNIKEIECLEFDKNNEIPILKKSEDICNNLKMKDYQDFIKYYPKLCPDSEELKKKLTYMEICDNIAKQFIINDENQNEVNSNEKLNNYIKNAFKNIDKTYTQNVAFEYLPDKLEDKKKEIINFIEQELAKEFTSDKYEVEVSLS